MTLSATQTELVEKDGVLVGPYRRPRNMGADAKGSIHDDHTAKKLGFRGGTVAGSIHMEQFVPLLLRAFGDRWFETGGLSTYFRNATTDRDPVRAFVQLPEHDVTDAQVRVWMDDADEKLVLEGTASIGSPENPSMLRLTARKPALGKDLRIFERLEPGAELAPVPTKLTTEAAKARLDVTTEPLDWYEGPSPWGGAIANPSLMVDVMRPVEQGMDLRGDGAVGLFGAIEVRHLNGPVFREHDYEVSGKVLNLGETPKTEYVWYESLLTEPGSGKEVASMIMMLRFMKGSSSLWQDR